MNSMSETMRELIVMELADPLRMLRLSATKELTKTSESTNRISETMRELMVMVEAEAFVTSNEFATTDTISMVLADNVLNAPCS
jgi:hypothetical protein